MNTVISLSFLGSFGLLCVIGVVYGYQSRICYGYYSRIHPTKNPIIRFELLEKILGSMLVITTISWIAFIPLGIKFLLPKIIGLIVSMQGLIA